MPVKLNVGGVKYITNESTIRDSMLERMIGSNVPSEVIDGYTFIDRDGIIFRHVLNYMRDKQVTCKDGEIPHLLVELDYYCVEHDIVYEDPEDILFVKADIECRNYFDRQAPILIQIGAQNIIQTVAVKHIAQVIIEDKLDEFRSRYNNESHRIGSKPMYGGIAWGIGY